MNRLRAFFLDHRHGAFLLFALALSLRLLLPAGTMPVAEGAQGVRVLLCDGHGSTSTREIPLHRKDAHHGQEVCAFSVLGTVALSGDAALALPDASSAHVDAPRPVGNRPELRAFSYAHPPQRGPPGTA